MRYFLSKYFFCDLRFLSLFRILFSAVFIVDLIARFNLSEIFYSNSGVFSPNYVLSKLPDFKGTSIYFFFGSSVFIKTSFIFILLCSIGLLLGYKTRFFSIVLWFFFINIMNRNPFVYYGADLYFLNFFFIGMFLPWNHYYSLDKRKKKKRLTRFSSPMIAFFIIQVVVIYLSTVYFKLNDLFWQNGKALYFILQTNLSLIDWSSDFLKTFSPFFTYFVLLAQLSVIFFFISYKGFFARRISIALLLAVHSATFFLLDLHIFSVLPMTPLIALIVFSKASISKSFCSLAFLKTSSFFILFVSLNLFFNFYSFKNLNQLENSLVYKLIQPFNFSQKWDFFSPTPRQSLTYSLEAYNSYSTKDITPFPKFSSLTQSKPRWSHLLTSISSDISLQKSFTRYFCKKVKPKFNGVTFRTSIKNLETQTQKNSIIFKHSCN